MKEGGWDYLWIFVLYAVLGVIAIAAGCAPAYRAKDVGPPEWDGKCLGRPGDAGRQAWWYGPPWPPQYDLPVGTRYVCKDHGQARHGFWFEAMP